MLDFGSANPNDPNPSGDDITSDMSVDQKNTLFNFASSGNFNLVTTYGAWKNIDGSYVVTSAGKITLTFTNNGKADIFIEGKVTFDNASNTFTIDSKNGDRGYFVDKKITFVKQ